MSERLFPISEEEYESLSKEDKLNYDLIKSCILNDDRINNAAVCIMKLLNELSENPNKYEPEELHARLDSIYSNLNKEEIVMLNKFELACINFMGMYKEEKKQVKKLKKKGR